MKRVVINRDLDSAQHLKCKLCYLCSSLCIWKVRNAFTYSIWLGRLNGKINPLLQRSESSGRWRGRAYDKLNRIVSSHSIYFDKYFPIGKARFCVWGGGGVGVCVCVFFFFFFFFFWKSSSSKKLHWALYY